MYKISKLFILFFALVFLASAANVEKVQVNSVNANSLIIVEGELDFNSVIPGYDYNKELAISLNLTDSMLEGLTSDNVTVFVRVKSSKSEKSALRFSVDGVESNGASFYLSCILTQNKCARSSPISKIVKVRLAANSEVFDEEVIINASFVPFVSTETKLKASEVISTAGEIGRELELLKQKIVQQGGLEQYAAEIQAINQSILLASEQAASYDVGNAGNSINGAQQALNELKTVTERNSRESSFSGNLLGNVRVSWELIFAGVIGLFVIVGFLSFRKRENVNIDNVIKDDEKRVK